ncbi:pentatricopeptide repeat-containing protein At1g09900-like isoform X2 [Rhodamnia argentea]|nr:pentatricopeptide repeat-containing protein At1g09900-like isoform X2 [Rhodamnia argentea]
MHATRKQATRKQSQQIMELIKSGPDDLELQLDLMNVRPSLSSAIHIFRTLNSKKVSALRFFRWTENSWPDLGCNPNICSLVIDNCGRLEDYETMLLLLKEFTLNGVCLTEKAFTFLIVLRSSVMDAVNKTIKVLNQVGGSCRNSGIFALIETLSRLGSFEIAKHVIQITEVKASYYNIMAREKCRRCDFEDVKVMIDEMRQAGFGPITGIYNYFISSLCRSGKLSEALHVIEEMEGTDCPPNALTFEILINHYIREEKMNVATQLLDRMALNGIEPRITTHTAFVKGYFHREQPEEAYKYAVSSCVNNSSNETYSLLARLHLKKGDTITAQKILLEMIEKGLKPSLRVHWGVLKTLKKVGELRLAQELASSFARFKTRSNSEAG